MRVLVLTLIGGRSVLVNTDNITTVWEHESSGNAVTVNTNDKDETIVTHSLDEIQNAWKYGSDFGTVTVFDTKAGP